MRVVAALTWGLVVLCTAATSYGQSPLGTGFTYQGKLKQDGAPLNGTVDLVFKLYNAASGGLLMGTQTISGVVIVDGLFTVELNDLGEFAPNAFNGEARWLEVSVNGTALTPRQPITAAPYAQSLKPGATISGSIPWSRMLQVVNSAFNGTALYAEADNNGGIGVYAQSANNFGVYARSDINIGVYGQGDNNIGVKGTSVAGNGLWGDSTLWNGVFGHSAQANGVWGRTDAGASGVYGEAGVGGKGVAGFNSHTNSIGVFGEANATGAVGVYGKSDGNTGVYGVGAGAGVWGQSTIVGGKGVYGINSNQNSTGVFGEANATGGVGVYGKSDANTGVYGVTVGGKGVWGYGGTGSGAIGVHGETHGVGGIGVHGIGALPGTHAAWFDGDVNITGNLSKAGGSFCIDHPLDPANKYLYHSFVESPDMMNIYNGNITTDDRGYAEIAMPDWFMPLNNDFRYQLTVLDDANSDEFVQVKIVKKINGGRFTIRTSRPKVEVSWQVTGVRQDVWANAHRIQVEVEKSERDRGKYLVPELYGLPAEMSIGPRGAANAEACASPPQVSGQTGRATEQP